MIHQATHRHVVTVDGRHLAYVCGCVNEIDPAYGALLLALYGAGHCGVIVLAGTFTGAVQGYLDWNEKTRGAVVLKKACGVLVLLGGLYLLYTAR